MKRLSSKTIAAEVVGKSEGPLSRAEETRYKALKGKLLDKMDIISSAFVEMGAILRDIRDERLYRGEFTAFEDFCRQYVGASKRYVNRIIQAEGVIEALLEAGEDKATLPNSVRLTRELALYPKSEMQKIWRYAKQLALADGKVKPDSNTVREAAAKLESSPQAVDRAIEALIQKIEGMERALTMSIGWDQIGPREVLRLKEALGHIVSKAAALLKSAPPEGLVEDLSAEDDEEELASEPAIAKAIDDGRRQQPDEAVRVKTASADVKKAQAPKEKKRRNTKAQKQALAGSAVPPRDGEVIGTVFGIPMVVNLDKKKKE